MTIITVDSRRARVRRFHDLYCGLARETAIPHAEDNDPLLFLERRAYKAAVHNAIAGIEDARVVLATAIQRIEEGTAKTERQIETRENAGGGRVEIDGATSALVKHPFSNRPPAQPA